MSENTKADKWTKTAAVVEAAIGFISNTYWLATLFDLASGMNEEIAGLSYYALGFGMVGAIFSSAGSTYSHYLLNDQHQQPRNHTDINQLKTRLTKIQMAALAGDFISHVGETAAPLIFVTNLAFKNNLLRESEAAAQGTAILVGVFGSVANVRTCKNSMIDSNKKDDGEATFLINNS